MRLTLRTLLAYLDNTLESDDAEALRVKLSESGFATQLVQRIRASLTNPALSAPDHNAVNPIAEANVISEYLDSTLASEPEAEIERACLDSDMHLAEAAACHQILTMVLGKPAEVPDALRNRIYELPDRDVAEIAKSNEIPKSGSFASVSLPNADTLTGIPSDVPAEPVLVSSGPPITPVGRADSGVSDAPSRIRDSDTIGDSGRRDQIEKSDLYGGIRASRVTPWLVALALAGVFLFSLVRILDPLFNPVAKVDPESEKIGKLYPELEAEEPEIEVSAADSPVMEQVGTPGVEIEPAEPVSASELPMAELPAPNLPTADLPAPGLNNAIAGDNVTESGTAIEEMPAPNGAAPNGDAPSGDATSGSASVGVEAPIPAGLPLPGPSDVVPIEVVGESSGSDGDVPMKSDPSISDAPGVDPSDAAAMKSDPDPGTVDPGTVDPDAKPPVKELADGGLKSPLATLKSESPLLFTEVKKRWGIVGNGSGIIEDAVLVNAPKFRANFSINGKANVELVDATQIHFTSAETDSEIAGINVDFGRLLITSVDPNVLTQVRFGGKSVAIEFAEAGSIAAVEVRYARRPGFDAFSEKNHLMLARVFSVQGDLTLTSGSGDETLTTGKQWMIRGSDPHKLSELAEIPGWIDAAESPLDDSARTGLLELLKQEQSTLLSLQEATMFRKSEVAALAAQTMLHLGRADVFFGTDGVLSQPKQRTYWTDHFVALRSMVNRSPEAAKEIRDNIGKMDAADGAALFRLLTGYSQNQLVEGADEKLLELLDSASMSVRVLALENLREITGVNLNYRPEEENAVRRKAAVKKWQVRQRKGDIRWP